MQVSVQEMDVSKTKELFIDNYQLFNTCKTRGRVSFEEGEICERGKSRTKLCISYFGHLDLFLILFTVSV